MQCVLYVVVRWLLFVMCCLLCVVRCVMFAVYCLLLVVHWLIDVCSVVFGAYWVVVRCLLLVFGVSSVLFIAVCSVVAVCC